MLQILIWITCLPIAAGCGMTAYAGFGSRQPLTLGVPASMGTGVVLFLMIYMLEGARAVGS